MKTLQSLLALGLLSITVGTSANPSLNTCQQQNDVNGPFGPVLELFAGVSAIDHDRMRATATDDFQLLEVGEVWDMKNFTDVVKPNPFIRRNYFDVIKTDINENFAWISYWNKAAYTKKQPKTKEDEKIQEVAWLESAVMVRTKAGWKVQMLHSTRIKAEDLPKDVQLCEYVG